MEDRKRGRPPASHNNQAAGPSGTPALAKEPETLIGMSGRIGHGNTFELQGRLLWLPGESWEAFEARAFEEFRGVLQQQYRSQMRRTMTAG